MSKIQMKDVPREKRIEMVGRFYEIVTGLSTKKDVIGFFMGLLTPSEALMFARRIEVAGMLIEGKSYNDIIDALGVGKSTVMNVSTWLYGEEETFRAEIKKQLVREGKLTPRKKKSHFNIVLEPYAQFRALQRIIDNHM